MRILQTSTPALAFGFVAGFYLAFFLPSTPFAATQPTDFTCADVRKALLKVSVHVENIANKSTSRTPEGGPYKKGSVSCESLVCAVARKNETYLVYGPNHPDANKEGYVALPSFDIASEFAAASIAATELRLLASKGVCGSASLAMDRSAMIKYDPATGVASDIFNFNVDGRLVSWSRTNRDGSSLNYNFDPDGSIPQKTWNGWINPTAAAQVEKTAVKAKPVASEVIMATGEQ